MVPRLSTAQVDRLGDRLRRTTEIAEPDLEALQAFRAEHETALVEVQRRIEKIMPGVDQTARIKTIQTLHDKLRRQSTKLSRIQDIAGVRIVQDMDRLEQDRLAAVLERAFPRSKVVDRRVSPMFGYRAVHVVIQVDRCSVEIQLRTRIQHLWAEVVERLGDRWGRQIRYGGTPDDPELMVNKTMNRTALWNFVGGLSDIINALEEAEARRQFAVDAGLDIDELGLSDVDSLRRDLEEALARLLESVKRSRAL